MPLDERLTQVVRVPAIESVFRQRALRGNGCPLVQSAPHVVTIQLYMRDVGQCLFALEKVGEAAELCGRGEGARRFGLQS